jgi:hypothetical protein
MIRPYGSRSLLDGNLQRILRGVRPVYQSNYVFSSQITSGTLDHYVVEQVNN